MTAPATEQIHGKMIEALREISAIGKSAKNVDAGFAARSIDDVMDALHSVFRNVGIYAVPEVLEAEYVERETTTQSGKKSVVVDARLLVRYRFYAEDGSSVDATVRTEGRDYADKASTKALSQAYKYAMLQTFSIPLSGQPDADTETISVEPDLRTRIVASKHPENAVKKLIVDRVDGDVEVAATIWRAITATLGIDEGTIVSQTDALLLYDEFERTYG